MNIPCWPAVGNSFRAAVWAVVACAVACAWSGPAFAQLTWSAGANTTWDTSSANWNPGPAAWTANSNAVFDATPSVANRAITVSGTQSVGTLTVSSTNYSFSGGALRYTQGTSGTWLFQQGATINSGITATLSGTNRAFFTSTNTSTAGTVTITGPVTIQGSGTTWLNPDGRFTFSGSTLTLQDVGLRLGFSGGSTYRFENSTVSITSSQTSGVDRGISMPAGTITVVSSTITTPVVLAGNGGGGSLTMTSGLLTTGSLILNPYNGTNVGNLNLDGGVIELTELQRGNNNAGATTVVNLNFNGGTLRALQNNSVFINLVAPPATTNGRVLAGGARFDTNGFDITVSQPLVSGTANDGGLVKLSAGTLTLSASNGYLGATAINGGVLLLSNSNALAGGGNVTFGGGTLRYSANNRVDYSARIANSGSAVAIDTNAQGVTFASAIGSSNTGGLTKLGSGTLSLSGSNGFTGATTLSAGVLAVGGNALAGGGNVTFSGGTLQYLAGNASDYAARIKNSGSAVAIDTAGQSVTYNGVIDASNTAGLTKSGSGTLTLAGVNTYTGTTTVNAGTLAAGSGAQFGSTGIVKVAAGTLDLAGNNLTIRGLFNDAGQTSAVVTNSGTGTVILTSTTPAGVIQNLTFYGTLADGPGGGKLGLSVGQSNGFGVAANIFVLGAGGTATYSGPTIVGTGLGSATVAGLVNPNSAYTVNGGAFLDVSGVTGTIGSLSGGFGAITNFAASPATLSVGSLGTDSQYQGRIEDSVGTLAITKVGGGRLTFLDFGTNSYTGLTTVSQGVLNIQKGTALGTTAAGTVVSSGAALEIQGNIAVGAEALTLAGTGVGGAGALRNISGTNTYAGAITLASAARINSDLGRLTLSGAVGGSGLNLSVGGVGNVTIAGNIGTGGGSLTKDGAGSLVLSGSNSYSGGTLVDAGTLFVNGSLGAGVVSVASGATLGGSGVIGGAVSILGGGIVAPGTSPGTLTVNDSFTLADTSILNFELNAANTTVGGGINDLITGVTNLTLDGVLNVSGSGDWTTIANNTSWRLFDYTGTLTNGSLAIGSQPTLGSGQSFKIDTATTGQVNLVIVPEPGGVLLAAAGLVGATWLGRRRRA